MQPPLFDHLVGKGEDAGERLATKIPPGYGPYIL
jgi:hypothetical protein